MATGKLTDDQIAAAKADWIDGLHVRDMQVKYDCTRGTIYGLNHRGKWPSRDYVRESSPDAVPANRARPKHFPQHARAGELPIDPEATRSHDARMGRPGSGLFAVPVTLAPKFENTSYKPRPVMPSHQRHDLVPKMTLPEVAAKIRPIEPKPESAKAVTSPPVKYGRVVDCAWPMGHPKTPTFRYCDEPSEAGKPYCGAHGAVAYDRPSWRNRYSDT